MHKTLIGLLTYNDLHYLKHSLQVVESLRMNLPADVAVMDTAENDEIRDYIQENYPHFKYHRHRDGNIGYGRTWNELLRLHPGHDFFLVYTSDVLLHEPTVKSFLQRMEEDPELMMCAGKLHYWDAEHGVKTDQIDSLGIVAERRHHFHELGSGERDLGQYDDQLDEIFGLTGAVFLIRTSVTWELYENDYQIFDERMWMYKEDVDLAYRLRWLGLKLQIFPEVWGWHARTVANRGGQDSRSLSDADARKPGYGRLHSYKNHLLMLKNNLSWRLGGDVLGRVLIYELMKAVFLLLRHPKVFVAGLQTLLFTRARRSDRRVSPSEIRKRFR